MAVGDFDTYYGDNPWTAVDKNTRDWYFPDVVMIWRRKGVYSRFVPWQFNLRNVRAKKAIITQLLPPHPNANTIGLRDMWANAEHMDSREIEVVFNRYGGKLAYHKYDDLVTYWRQNRRAGLRRIIQQGLGIHMVDSLDLIARNAYLSGALTSGYAQYSNDKTDFATLTSTDTFDINSVLDIWLGMVYRDVADAVGASGVNSPGTVFCITSPGVIYDIQKSIITGTTTDEWVAVQNYANPKMIVSRYEIGQYKGVRFIQDPDATLWNCGVISFQADVTAPLKAGDGAPDPSTTKVDGTYGVGQSGAIHYVQLSATPTVGVLGTDLKESDIVTIHVSKTNDFGVTGGVDFRDSRNHVRRVVSVDTVNNRITLDKPLMLDFNADLGGGVYAYVTKGRHIHASLFIGAPNGVVGAVAQPPMVHTPPPVDDFESMYRFSWDAYLGLNLFRPDAFEVMFSAGTVRVKGAAVI